MAKFGRMTSESSHAIAGPKDLSKEMVNASCRTLAKSWKVPADRPDFILDGLGTAFVRAGCWARAAGFGSPLACRGLCGRLDRSCGAIGAMDLDHRLQPGAGNAQLNHRRR